MLSPGRRGCWCWGFHELKARVGGPLAQAGGSLAEARCDAGLVAKDLTGQLQIHETQAGSRDAEGEAPKVDRCREAVDRGTLGQMLRRKIRYLI